MFLNYLLLFFSALLIAVNFLFNKYYQKHAGNTLLSGTVFNMFNGLFTVIVFLVLNRFRLEYTGFSVWMAFLQTICLFSYCLLGFSIMARGKLALYTLFLMSGGMIVPYLYGILFLDEQVSVLRILGLIVIAAAVILSNFEKEARTDAKTLFYCILVFFLNGGTSVTAKIHQIGRYTTDGSVYKNVSSTGFCILTGLWKCVFGLVILSVLFLLPGREEKKPVMKKCVGISMLAAIVLSAVVSGISYRFQLDGAALLPATVLYPIITGGTILFTGLLSMAVFREKLTKRLAACLVLCLAGTCMFL